MTQEDPIASIRRRFPTSAGLPADIPAGLPDVPFAARFGVLPQLAKHEREPTKTTTSIPTQVGGDGAGKAPRPDDTIVPATD